MIKLNIKFSIYLFSFFLIISSAQITFSQEINSSVSEIEEILVTAQRRSENIDDVPIAISVADQQALRNAGITDIRDLGSIVAGLTFAGQGGIAVPSIRGMQSRQGQAGNEQPTAIYLDGVYQPNQLVNVLELADVEQVEVLRGPQGTLFGRNNTGGAILVSTKKPQYETEGNLTLDYGYYTGSDQDSGDMLVKGYLTGALIDNTLAYSISGYYRDVEGFLTNMNNGGQSGQLEKYHVRAKLLWEPSPNLSALLTLTKGHADDLMSWATQSFQGNGASGFYDDGITSSKPWHVASELKNGSNPQELNQEHVSLIVEYDIEGSGTLRSTTSYSNDDVDFVVDLDTGTSASCKAAFVCLDFWQDYPSETIQQEFLFSSEQSGKFSYVVGLYYYETEAVFGFNVNPVIVDGYADRTRSGFNFIGHSTDFIESRAIFGEINYDISDQLRLIAGVRYTEEEKYGEGTMNPRYPAEGAIEDDAWTPRVALHYDVNEETSIYASISKGFKSSVLNNGTSQNEFGTKPEYVTNLEVGLKKTTSDYRVALAVFGMKYKDQQAQVWDGQAAILSNADESDIYGIEIEGNYSVNENLQVYGTFSYLKSEYGNYSSTAYELPMTAAGFASNEVIDLNGRQLIIAPEFTGSLGFNYQRTISSGLLEFNGNFYYSDEFWFDFLERVNPGSYNTLAASVSLTPNFNENLKLSLFGKNLTNEEYFASSLLGPSSDAPVYMPPRMIGISLDYNF